MKEEVVSCKIKQHGIQSTHQKSLLKRMWEHKVLYLMILPCLLFPYFQLYTYDKSNFSV